MALSGNYYPTITLAYVHIVSISDIFELYRNEPEFSTILHNMQSKFNKYFSPLPILIGFGMLIDHRFKEFGLTSVFMSLYGNLNDEHMNHMNKIKYYFEIFFNEYSVTFGNSGTLNPPSASSDIGSSNKGKGKTSMLASILNRGGMSTSRGLTELQQYYNAPMVSVEDPDFDILAWWKGYESRFPILSTMARDILTVPMSTVASESAFSTGGRVIDEHRSCLDGKTVEALMCLQDWYAAEARDQNMEINPPMPEFEVLEI